MAELKADPEIAPASLRCAWLDCDPGPVQEFNIQTDPHAAAIVFNSAVPVAMVPIEVTHTVLATPEIVEKIEEMGTSFSSHMVDLLMFFSETYRKVFNFESPPVHDPVAVVYLLYPHLFEARKMRVDVELNSALAAGQTICDVWNQSDQPPNVTVAQKVDVEGCWTVIMSAIKRCNKISPLNR